MCVCVKRLRPSHSFDFFRSKQIIVAEFQSSIGKQPINSFVTWEMDHDCLVVDIYIADCSVVVSRGTVVFLVGQSKLILAAVRVGDFKKGFRVGCAVSKSLQCARSRRPEPIKQCRDRRGEKRWIGRSVSTACCEFSVGNRFDSSGLAVCTNHTNSCSGPTPTFVESCNQ